ncbi:MAG: hypothetical protein A3I09_01095 [Deltaproteobacteria bacterium RIFCSPLOWO2_02_FULL_47_10]|nr:MAG: hypothetical protein A3I09_01095 [Deltaproteobacteria bacterium RIFCSPLOWO2_02_FULL_47_10]
MEQSGTPAGSGQSGTGLAPNIASLLAYICPPITSIVFLLIEKENLDVKFHAWQGTAMGVAWIVLVLGLNLLAAIFGAIWSLLGIVIGFFVPIVFLATVIIWIVCLIKAYQGERWKIPYLGDFAAKKAGV